VAEALRHIEIAVASIEDARISYQGTPRARANWAGCPDPPRLSLWPTGREVRLRLHLLNPGDNPLEHEERELATLWGIVVPLGFTPMLRYPIPGLGQEVFHFLGPWQALFDHLCGEARGEYAWPSVCCAAQCDVGTWGGDRRLERFVQSQLHRLGLHCGPVDGIIGERSASAIRALTMKGMALAEMAKTLAGYEPPEMPEQERRVGHIIYDGDDLTVLSYGKVATMRTRQGATMTVDGPGRVILTIGQEV
jgi:hypothetical protein